VRRLAVIGIVACVGTMFLGAVAHAKPSDQGVSIATLSPSAGPPGTVVAFTLTGTDADGTQQCTTSSAYRLEFLGADGVLGQTGGESVEVPSTATPGPAFVRLVCYVPDPTGRRVIRGVCAGFTVQPTVATAAQPVAVSCPSTPRLALGQSVLNVERLLSGAFNAQLSAPLSP
jgi:hypothetical protein